MAMSNHYDSCEDFTVCPVCFEKLQTPRFLPCTHTFCHRCLSAHIESSCKDCDPALGFPCPVCRAFVPAPGVLHQYPIKDWASRFPENLLLSNCIRKQTSLTDLWCGPCKIDCEIDIKAGSWCVECEDSLCEKCSQNHRKYKALQSHQIFPITNYGFDYTRSLKLLETDLLKCCDNHENRNIEFVCGTHQTGCCSLCIVNEHKHCENISTLLKAVDTFSDETKVKLVQEIEDLISKIETIVQKEKQNISDLDDKKDTYTEKITKMIEEMVNRLKTQEKTYLDQLAEVSKHARQKLEGSLRLLEQRKMYLTHWLEIVSTASQNIKTKNFLKCLTTKEVLEAVKDLPLIQMSFDLSAKVSRGIEMIDTHDTLFSVKVTEHSVNFNDIQKEIVSEKRQAFTSSSSHANESSEWALKPDKAYNSKGCDSKPYEANESKGWDSQPYEVNESKGWDSQPKANESKRWDSQPYEVNESEGCASKPYEANESKGWDSQPYEANESKGWDSQPYKANKPKGRDSQPYKANEFKGWDSKPYEANESKGWDSQPYEANKSKGRDSQPYEVNESKGWDSQPYKANESKGWDSQPYEANESKGWDSQPYKANKSKGRDSQPYEANECKGWDSKPYKANKSKGRDSKPYEANESKGWDSQLYEANESKGWDSQPYEVNESKGWDLKPYEANESKGRASQLYEMNESKGWE